MPFIELNLACKSAKRLDKSFTVLAEAGVGVVVLVVLVVVVPLGGEVVTLVGDVIGGEVDLTTSAFGISTFATKNHFVIFFYYY